MVSKSQILELIQLGHAEILHFASIVPVEDRTVPGEPDQWGAKDILAHIGEWQLQNAAKMAGTRRIDPDVSGAQGKEDDENALIFQNYRAAAWDEVISLLESAHTRLLDLTRSISEEDLNQSDRFPRWMEGRPLWRGIVSDVYQHVMAHLNPELIRLGALDHVRNWQEQQMNILPELDASDEWQGTCLYNNACTWALLGEPQKALDLLEKALRLRPELADWSKQDSDLASLHSTPEFEALLGQAWEK